MSSNVGGLLADDAPVAEREDFRELIARGQERGALSFVEIALCLEEVEVTKEQLLELHAHLQEQGIDIVGSDGEPVTSENAKVEAAAQARGAPGLEP